MNGDDETLLPILDLLEKHGSFTLSTRTLEGLASRDVRGALHAAGVVTGAPAVPTWPCEVPGCAREVRSNHDGARHPLVAVCSRVPSECEAVDLSFEDVAQQRLHVSAVVAAACALLGASMARGVLPKLDATSALGEPYPPVHVAMRAAPASDVFWCAHPRETDLAAFCARRERVARRTLVLVPTGRHIPLDVAARFAAGEPVEIVPLADTLAVRDGTLVLTTLPVTASPRMTPPPIAFVTPADSEPPPTPRLPKGPKRNETLDVPGGLAGALGVTRWEELRMSMIDEMTVRIQGNGKSVVKTFLELGFLDRRKVGEAMPVRSWSLFVHLCREGGFRPSAYAAIGGKKWGAKKAVQSVRDALKGAFGLEGDPLREYTVKNGWRARFQFGERSS